MIDVHCLRHNDERVFFPQLLKQLGKEECINLFVLKNDDNIGAGRVKGFLTGTSDYVSFVDYDDLIEPGIFKKINDVMDTGVPWCYTDEMLIDESGNILQPGWSSDPKLYTKYILGFVDIGENMHCHHILTFRRELITSRIKYIMKQLKELPEEYLKTELMQYERKHIETVGYYWRQHENNGYLNYECSRDYREAAKQ
ncbi:MAG: hypothetical protein GY714_20255 [Desulfobacterales bacterium]|nr:hypothetical protein [Desulfobacterales bacterium]